MYDVGCERSSHTTQQRSEDTGDTPGGTDEARVFTAVLERDDVRNGDLHELENTSAADSLNGPRDDKPDHTLCGSAQRGTDLSSHEHS